MEKKVYSYKTEFGKLVYAVAQILEHPGSKLLRQDLEEKTLLYTTFFCDHDFDNIHNTKCGSCGVTIESLDSRRLIP